MTAIFDARIMSSAGLSAQRSESYSSPTRKPYFSMRDIRGFSEGNGPLPASKEAQSIEGPSSS